MSEPGKAVASISLKKRRNANKNHIVASLGSCNRKDGAGMR
jgi:hypothetical protein